MTAFQLNLPVEIPWKIIGVSPDMMDTAFSDSQFPPDWKTSLAISAFEPKLEDQPPELCDERIAFLKVTVTVTGYQPSREEVAVGKKSFPWLSPQDREDILGEYFACYGVLLHIAVFPPLSPVVGPGHKVWPLEDYPHFIDFEPKVRDFYQAATDSGEVLTASQSKVNTGKTFTHTETTETGYKLGAAVEFPIATGVTGKVSGEVSRKQTDTDGEQWTVGTDASRERREHHGTTTELSQMYNLLSAYYSGTNRAAFLMLPRPHILQPTDHRTFVQGLRIIEGIQEFFLIVVRPRDMNGLCVEATLDTGHFPEDVEVNEPDVEYEESFEEFTVTASASGSRLGSGDCTKIETSPSATYVVGQGYVIDRRAARKDGQIGDPGHPGLREGADSSNDRGKQRRDYNYRAIDDTTAQVSGTICGESWSGAFSPGRAIFDCSFRVLTRSQEPKPSSSEPVVTTDLLIVSRRLSACYRLNENCIEIVSLQPDFPDFPTSIVDMLKISVPARLLTADVVRQTRMPVMKEALRKIQFALTTSGSRSTRLPLGSAGFLESDYFKERIRKILPTDRQETRLSDLPGISDEIVERLGRERTLGDLLKMDLDMFASEADISLAEAIQARRRLLGLADKEAGAPTYDRAE